MAWYRPDDLKLVTGQHFEYTNVGEHAIHAGKAGLPVFVGTVNAFGEWRSVHRRKGLQHMDKPQFIWRDDPIPVEPPAPMTDWRHRNGNIYGVFLITNVDSDRPQYPPTVVYVNKANGKWYSRPVADWHRSMTEVKGDDE